MSAFISICWLRTSSTALLLAACQLNFTLYFLLAACQLNFTFYFLLAACQLRFAFFLALISWDLVAYGYYLHLLAACQLNLTVYISLGVHQDLFTISEDRVAKLHYSHLLAACQLSLLNAVFLACSMPFDCFEGICLQALWNVWRVTKASPNGKMKVYPMCRLSKEIK